MIVSRDLEFRFSTGEVEPVRISIEAPVPAEEPGMWWCAYSIAGTTIQKSFRLAGIDSVQALTLVLATMPAELERIAKRCQGEFWFLGEPGHLFSEVRGQV